MKHLLSILGVLAFLAGVVVFLGSKSAVHEIEGLILLLISAVLVASASIIEALHAMSRPAAVGAAIPAKR